MEDSALIGPVGHRTDGLNEKLVIRHPSPVRIERLLLTRVFELTAGRIGAGMDDTAAQAVVTSSQPEISAHGRKEAA